MTAFVLYDAHGDGSATITLNRPERLNAISRPLIAAFIEALEAARADPAVRVVLLRAAGRAFCSGEDLTDLAEHDLTADEMQLWSRRLQDITRLLMFSDFHVVAQVQGWVLGGGAAWPLNADLALWSEDARMFLPEAGYGLFVSGAVSFLLPERCGPERARFLMLSGERADIATLLRDRIADRAVPIEDLEREGRATVERLLALPPRTLLAYKRARIDQVRDPVERALAFELQANLGGLNDPALVGRLPGQIAFKSAD
jgi:enoyl-CoA hydratase/carnithine racemase